MQTFYLKALYEFEAIGHHRYVAAVENNIGFLLLLLDPTKTRKNTYTFSEAIGGYLIAFQIPFAAHKSIDTGSTLFSNETIRPSS
jgi:hypothetical protein